MKLRLPNLSELRLYHFEALKDVKEEGMNAYDKIALVNKLTGLDKEVLMTTDLNDINRIIEHYFSLVVNIDKENIDKEIKVAGKNYVLVKKFSKMPMKWHIDRSAFDLKDLSILMAFCYIEKGMSYCEQDSHKNILNPVMARAELFREMAEMQHFVKVGFFFQKKAENYTKAFTEIKRLKEMNESTLDINGRTL